MGLVDPKKDLYRAAQPQCTGRKEAVRPGTYSYLPRVSNDISDPPRTAVGQPPGPWLTSEFMNKIDSQLGQLTME